MAKRAKSTARYSLYVVPALFSKGHVGVKRRGDVSYGLVMTVVNKMLSRRSDCLVVSPWMCGGEEGRAQSHLCKSNQEHSVTFVQK